LDHPRLGASGVEPFWPSFASLVLHIIENPYINPCAVLMTK